ncbi:MAG: hypothetical protein Q4G64_10715, partial [bacterium]|nr:hypothetical protein [bacterium]
RAEDDARQVRAALEKELALARELSEKANSERMSQMRISMEEVVGTARTQAQEAEKRLAEAVDRASTVRREADQSAATAVKEARAKAEEILSRARTDADRLRNVAEAEAQLARNDAEAKVRELTRQQDSISAYLDEMKSTLGFAAAPPPPSGEETSGEDPHHP